MKYPFLLLPLLLLLSLLQLSLQIKIHFNDKIVWRFHERTLSAFGFDQCHFEPVEVSDYKLPNYYLNITSDSFLETMLSIQEECYTNPKSEIKHGFYTSHSDKITQQLLNQRGNELFAGLIQYFIVENGLEPKVKEPGIKARPTSPIENADPSDKNAKSEMDYKVFLVELEEKLSKLELTQIQSNNSIPYPLLPNQVSTKISKDTIQPDLPKKQPNEQVKITESNENYIYSIFLFDNFIFKKGFPFFNHNSLRYRLLDIVGTGAYSYVYRVTHLTKHNSTLNSCYKRYKSIKNEIRIPLPKEQVLIVPDYNEINYHSLVTPHPNILSIYGGIWFRGEITGVLIELANENNLKHFIHNTHSPHLFDSYFISQLIGIANGLDHIHKRNILHRDIKMTNIMVNTNQLGNYFLKIADFSLACKKGECMQLIQSKDDILLYYPPELFHNLITLKDKQTVGIVNQRDSVDWYMFGTLLRDISLELAFKFKSVYILGLFLPLIQGLYFILEPSFRFTHPIIISYLEEVALKITFKLPIQVLTFYKIREKEEEKLISPTLSYQFTLQDYSEQGQLKNYSLDPSFFLSFIIVPKNCELKIDFNGTNCFNSPIKPPIIVQFLVNFPICIIGSCSYFQLKMFQKDEIVLIESNFEQTIFFCDENGNYDEEENLKWSKKNVSAEEIVDAIKLIGYTKWKRNFIQILH